MIFRKTATASQETRFGFLNKAPSRPRLPTFSTAVSNTPQPSPWTTSSLLTKDYIPLPKDDFASLIEAYQGVEDAKARYSSIIASKSSFEQLKKRYLASQRQIELEASTLEYHTKALNGHFFLDGRASVGILVRHTVEEHYRTIRLMDLKEQSDAEINKMKEEYVTNKQLLLQKKHYLKTVRKTKKSAGHFSTGTPETRPETKVRWADDIISHTKVIPCEEESEMLWDPAFPIDDVVYVSKRDRDRIVNEMAEMFDQVKEQQRELGDDDTIDWELKQKNMSKVVEEEEFAAEQLHEVCVSLSKVWATFIRFDGSKNWNRSKAWKKGHEFRTTAYKPSEATEKSILEKRRQCVTRLEKKNKKVEKKLASIRKTSKAQKQTE